MKLAIWKQTVAVAALSFTASTAFAGNFTTILNTGERTPGSTSSTATDAFYLNPSPSLPTSSWTQLASTTTSIYSPVNGNQVGSFIDTVWLDSSSNSYVIGSYFQLLNNTNGITEINSIVRSGFEEVATISAAWTSAAAVYNPGVPLAESSIKTGYRLRDPARSDYIASYVPGTPTTPGGAPTPGSAAAGAYLDLDKVAIRTDVSIGENNPNSGLYLLKFSAEGLTYQWTDNAVRIVQGASACTGGGECRLFADMKIGGYTVTAVPEAETYAMMMAGLALIGTIVRRRKSA